MDNQQESLRDIGWLCGIIDGEGTITLRFHRRKNNRPLIKPVVTIINTDRLIIDKILQIYEKLDIPYWITETAGTKRWKTRWTVETSGIRRLKRLLPHIIDHLVGKKQQAQIVQEWIEKRYNAIGNRSYYDDWDYEMVKKIKLLHGHQDKVEESLKILRDYTLNTEK